MTYKRDRPELQFPHQLWFFGAYNQKVIIFHISCRRCRVCEVAKTKHTPVREYVCVQNYPTEGYSKSIEAATILHIAISIVSECKFTIRWIVSHNDSIMCAHLHHSKDDPRDKDKLTIWVVKT